MPMPYGFYGPGPAKYTMKPLTGFTNHAQERTRNPMYSFQTKTKCLKPCPIGPGPAKYDLEGFVRYGKETPPAYSMVFKHKLARCDNFPGPKYDVKPVQWRAPAYSMQRKYKMGKCDATPGPLDYVPKGPVRYPAYSMQRKYKARCPDQVPGPYPYTKTTNFKTKEPAYTMISKAYPKPPCPIGPGPKYFPQFKQCMTGQAFGHRCTHLDVYYCPEDLLPACREFRRCS